MPSASARHTSRHGCLDRARLPTIGDLGQGRVDGARRAVLSALSCMGSGFYGRESPLASAGLDRRLQCGDKALEVALVQVDVDGLGLRPRVAGEGATHFDL